MAELNEILGNERIKEHFITAVHHKKICSVKVGKLRVW